jgi:hypothetical protein
MVETLKWQIGQARPFETDSPAVRAQKAAIVSNTQREVESARTQAAADANGGSNWTKTDSSNGSSSFQFKPGTAYKQLLQIAATGSWKNQ